MDRITEPKGTQRVKGWSTDEINAALKRLQSYEDTELTPTGITTLKAKYDDLTSYKNAEALRFVNNQLTALKAENERLSTNARKAILDSYHINPKDITADNLVLTSEACNEAILRQAEIIGEKIKLKKQVDAYKQAIGNIPLERVAEICFWVAQLGKGIKCKCSRDNLVGISEIGIDSHGITIYDNNGIDYDVAEAKAALEKMGRKDNE